MIKVETKDIATLREMAQAAGAQLICVNADACDILTAVDEMLRPFGLEVAQYTLDANDPCVAIVKRVSYGVTTGRAGDRQTWHFETREDAEACYEGALEQARLQYPEPGYLVDDHALKAKYNVDLIRVATVAQWFDKPAPVPEGKDPRRLGEPLYRVSLYSYDTPQISCCMSDCPACARLRKEIQ